MFSEYAIASPRVPYRVLVVDDDPHHRMLVREILAPPNYALSEAENGQQALNQLTGDDFDVVLMDKRMPGMDGDRACQMIRQQLGNRLLPILMVTGSTGIDDLTTSLQAGADDFIRKPYAPMELCARVDTAAQRKRLTDQLDNAESLLFALARMVEAKDSNTGDHCSRLAHSAVSFGRQLGLGEVELQALRRGGVLHDIGKLAIPDAILLKQGPLNDAEWEAMRQHSIVGVQLCSSLKSMSTTLDIIRHHHERWDGSGYPDGLAGEAIPLLARVFQLCDIHDALAHSRPYKKALPLEKVLAILQEEAEQGLLDPQLAAIFIDILRTRPALLRHDMDRSDDDLGAGLYQRLVSTGVLSGSDAST
jgi:putative two-component system response regulator